MAADSKPNTAQRSYTLVCTEDELMRIFIALVCCTPSGGSTRISRAHAPIINQIPEDLRNKAYDTHLAEYVAAVEKECTEE